MPCTYTGSLESDRALAAQDVIDRYKEELDRLTRYLCAVCSALQEDDDKGTLTLRNYLFEAAAAKGIDANEIFDWWVDHKAADLRKKIEALKKDPEYKTYLKLKEKFGDLE